MAEAIFQGEIEHERLHAHATKLVNKYYDEAMTKADVVERDDSSSASEERYEYLGYLDNMASRRRTKYGLVRSFRIRTDDGVTLTFLASVGRNRLSSANETVVAGSTDDLLVYLVHLSTQDNQEREITYSPIFVLNTEEIEERRFLRQKSGRASGWTCCWKVDHSVAKKSLESQEQKKHLFFRVIVLFLESHSSMKQVVEEKFFFAAGYEVVDREYMPDLENALRLFARGHKRGKRALKRNAGEFIRRNARQLLQDDSEKLKTMMEEDFETAQELFCYLADNGKSWSTV